MSLTGIKQINAGGRLMQGICFRITVLVFLGLTLAGCRFAISPFGTDAARLDQGEQAFIRGDYPAAREAFTVMLETATRPDTRAAALYGIACTDMITAEDSQAFLTAMDSFLQASTGENRCRNMNPRLLIRAVGHGTALMAEEKKEAMGSIAALSEREKKYKKERRKMQHLIKTLQDQISALENIDQERQEKNTRKSQ